MKTILNFSSNILLNILDDFVDTRNVNYVLSYPLTHVKTISLLSIEFPKFLYPNIRKVQL